MFHHKIDLVLNDIYFVQVINFDYGDVTELCMNMKYRY